MTIEERMRQIREQGAAKMEVDEETKARHKRWGWCCIIVGVVILVPCAWIGACIDSMFLAYVVPSVPIFFGMCLLEWDEPRHESHSTFHLLPKNPRYLRRKIRHGLGW